MESTFLKDIARIINKVWIKAIHLGPVIDHLAMI